MPPGMWTDLLSCQCCTHEYQATGHTPISLDCGHTICKPCLMRLHKEEKLCPFDSRDKITSAVLKYPPNVALLAIIAGGVEIVLSAVNESIQSCFATPHERESWLECMETLQHFAQHLQYIPRSAGSASSAPTGQLSYAKEMSSCAYINSTGNVTLSRPMQKKIISLVTCQLISVSGRDKLGRCLRSLGGRCITELILQHQHPHQLSGNLWGAVRSRGCQFLGPAMQEEVIRLILMALEDGSALSRKVLVLFVVQRLQGKYPQASKTAIGHVVQLLYRASCFKVMKRENESSLMQLKEEYCKYELLRYEHDKQIVLIAHEAGLRIAPDQWSSLLYGDTYHKSKMQSIIDKLQTPQSFHQSIVEFVIALERTNDPAKLSQLKGHLEKVATLTEGEPVSMDTARQCLDSMKSVLCGLTKFVEGHCHDQLNYGQIVYPKYKISMCRDLKTKGMCPRGPNCTFAHYESELERSRDGDDADETEYLDMAVDGYGGAAAMSPLVDLKPQAIVSPTTRSRLPPEPLHHHHDPSQGAYYYPTGPSNELPAGPVLFSPHQQPMSPSYYRHMSASGPPTRPASASLSHPVMDQTVHNTGPPHGWVAPGDMQYAYPPHQPDYYHQQHTADMGHAPHSAPHSGYYRHSGYPGNAGYHRPQSAVYPSYPGSPGLYGYAVGLPGQHYGGGSNGYPSQYQHVAHPREYSSISPVYCSPVRDEPQMRDDSHPAANPCHQPRQLRCDVIHTPDQQQLYEYQTRPAGGATQHTLECLRKRRDEILDKIQSSQRPVENESDSIKTEITRDRIEDLAHSLAVSMNAGSQQADLEATFVNNMLCTASKESHQPPLISVNVQQQPRSLPEWWHPSSTTFQTTTAETSPECQYDKCDSSVTSNSIPTLSTGQNFLATAAGHDTESHRVWTSWSGLTSCRGGVIQDGRFEWLRAKRSLSEPGNPPNPSVPPNVPPYSRSYSATESGEVIIPWSDSPYISKFGPISRSSRDNFVCSRVEQLTTRKESTEGSFQEESGCVGGTAYSQPLSAELDSSWSQLPIQVNARNVLTMPVTAVTPVRRPIPSPSLAQSKFKALPNDDHGFTVVTNADPEGSSSMTESVQLKHELRILNHKIDQVEAEAACEELTHIEHSIRRLELGTADTPPLPHSPDVRGSAADE